MKDGEFLHDKSMSPSERRPSKGRAPADIPRRNVLPFGGQPPIRNGFTDITSVLTRAIQRDVLARIALKASSETGPIRSLYAPDSELDLGGFISDLLSPAWARIRRRVEDHVAAVGSTAQLRVAFLEAAARRLGREWTADRASFSDVTVGVARLQFLSRCVASPPSPGQTAGPARRVLLSTPTGEQHHFALSLMQQLMRARGWDATIVLPDRRDHVRNAMTTKAYDLVCVSWSTGALAEAAFQFMDDVSAGCAAARPLVFGGGPAMEAAAGRMERLGVDLVCADARAAVADAAVWMSAASDTESCGADPGLRRPGVAAAS